MPTEKKVFCIMLCIGIVCAVFVPTTYTGDGPEYLAMLISFANHGTFALTAEDVRWIVDRIDPSFIDNGYFMNPDGSYYSFHFWMYPLICYPVFLLLEPLLVKALSVFIMTNIILLLVLSWWILFRVKQNLRNRLCLLVIALLNPVLLYVPWSHPEVYIYVFSLIGLLEFTDRRYFTSIFFLCFASLQASPLLLVPACVTAYLIVKRVVLPHDYWRLAAANAIGLLPMVFYWFYFRTWSLLAASGAAKVEYMSWEKAINLLLDPNYGLATYYPLLFAVLLFRVASKERAAIYGLGVMLLIIVSMTSQGNWNPGMMYIHRYNIWIIPIAMVVVFGYLVRSRGIITAAFLAGYLLTTGFITAACSYEYRTDNYLRFLPQTQWLLKHIPAAYNPPFEVLIERAWGKEIKEDDKLADFLSLQIYDKDSLRKELTLTPEGSIEYRNGPIKLSSSELYCFVNKIDELFTPSLPGYDDVRLRFGSGWYLSERDERGNSWRWMATNSSIGVLIEQPVKQIVVDMKISSYYRPRICTVYINGAKVFEKEIFAPTDINFEGALRKGINDLVITAAPNAESPAIKEATPDRRELSFSLSKFAIKSKTP